MQEGGEQGRPVGSMRVWEIVVAALLLVFGA
jgi:hypothetical protein